MNGMGRQRGRPLGWPAVAAPLALMLAACGGADGDDTSDVADEADSEDVAEPDPAEPELEPVELEVTVHAGPDQWQVWPLIEYTDAVEEASGGAVTFEYFFSGSLVHPSEHATALESGLADMAILIPSYTPDSFPVDSWISQAGFLSDSKPPVTLLEAAAATLDWSYSSEELQEEYAAAGLHPLFPHFQVHESYNLLCTQPVRDLDEAEGVRPRVGSPTHVAEAEAVGMAPEVIAGAEMYEAFQRGIVDCIMGAPADLIGENFWDIGTHYTDTSFSGFSSYAIAFGAESWESLDVEVQRLFWDAAPVYWENLFNSILDQHVRWVTEGRERGIEFFAPDEAFTEALSAHQESVLAGMPDEAPPEVSDPAGALADLVERHESWRRFITDEAGIQPPGDTWEDWVAEYPDGDMDIGPWVDRVISDVIEPQRP